MSHARIYRICLLIVVVLTIIGGIFYFINYMERNTKVTEGTLVLNVPSLAIPAKAVLAPYDSAEFHGCPFPEADGLQGEFPFPLWFLYSYIWIPLLHLPPGPIFCEVFHLCGAADHWRNPTVSTGRRDDQSQPQLEREWGKIPFLFADRF